jgi:hypothetical protein
MRRRGIAARSVSRNRKTGVYAIQFVAPDVNTYGAAGTDPAQAWAQRIEDCFDGVEIVDMYDTVADWRPNHPVLFATVYLRGDLTLKAA